MTLLLRQQPVASDLRFISAAMKVVTDVERIGDHAADIAEIVPHLAGVRKAGDPAVSRSIEMGRKGPQDAAGRNERLAAEDEAAAKPSSTPTTRWTTTSTASSGCWRRRSPPTRQGGRRAGSADGHQVSGAHRRPRREHRRVGGVPAHGPVSPREDVLSSVFPLFLFLKSCCPRRAQLCFVETPSEKFWSFFLSYAISGPAAPYYRQKPPNRGTLMRPERGPAPTAPMSPAAPQRRIPMSIKKFPAGSLRRGRQPRRAGAGGFG